MAACLWDGYDDALSADRKKPPRHPNPPGSEGGVEVDRSNFIYFSSLSSDVRQPAPSPRVAAHLDTRSPGGRSSILFIHPTKQGALDRSAVDRSIISIYSFRRDLAKTNASSAERSDPIAAPSILHNGRPGGGVSKG